MTRSYLVRHGAAGDRHAWHGADELRPLDEEGRRQAEALVPLLAEAVIERLLSSPYLRCVQTLEPLAAARGMPVETTPVLAEGAGGAGAVKLLSRDEGLVACSHGDVIEEALDLLAAAGVALEGRPRGAPQGAGSSPRGAPQGAGSSLAETPKGATWVFDVRNATIVKGVLLPPEAPGKIPEAPLKAPGRIQGG
ncbi:MAG TPA: phosphoglycerate mutase family protein [Actinomycetota bacterium]|nr:phosphoglycerate mutase family protein [Actinomycetota bacterium]